MRSSLSRTVRALLMVGGSLGGLAVSSVAPPAARAFDLEDYATTYRATRDAYLKAANELKLAVRGYELRTAGLRVAGFNLDEAEVFYFPLDRFDWSLITDHAGQSCVAVDQWGNTQDANGTPYGGDDKLCNTDSTCGGNGLCTERTSPYAHTDLKRIARQYPAVLQTMDDLPYQNANPGNGTVPPFNDTSLDDYFSFIRQERDRGWQIAQHKIQMAGHDDRERPAGDEFAGYLVPQFWATAQWQLFDPADPAAYEDVREELVTGFHASRDAMFKAYMELKLAEGPYRAANSAYVTATRVYTYTTACDQFSPEMPAGTWYCGSRANNSLSCVCTTGPGTCTGIEAVVVNEALPATSYTSCPATPTAEQPCLCVRNAARDNCSGTSTRPQE